LTQATQEKGTKTQVIPVLAAFDDGRMSASSIRQPSLLAALATWLLPVVSKSQWAALCRSLPVMLFYYDPLFLEHQTGSHPERPERVAQVARHLERTGLAAQLSRPAWQAASPERLARVHSLPYAESVARFAAAGGGRIEADTVCAPRSYDAALLAAGAVCDAVERVAGGQDRQAFCLVRPPGHHALADAAMGFCLFNNIAIGARVATGEMALDRVMIVDWDVHHGNGTQAAFWTDPQVGFLSIHRWPFYPGTGRSDETGSGRALGNMRNVPVEFGTARSTYLELFRSALEALAAHLRPQLVLVSAGFDSHRDDPIGSLELETEDFAQLTRVVLDVADTYAEGRVVSVLEGGYNTGILAGCVELHLREMLARDASKRSTT
jgi:acetoin utilization deacetylase AcuC-like enzyme